MLNRIASNPSLRKPTIQSISQITSMRSSRVHTPDNASSRLPSIIDIKALELAREQFREISGRRSKIQSLLKVQKSYARFLDLAYAFESVMNNFVEGNAVSGDGKIHVLKEVMYLEKMFFGMI
jgi:hypothetical protein